MSEDERQREYYRLLQSVAAFAKAGVDQDLFLAGNRVGDSRPTAWIPDKFWDWDRRPAFRNVLWNELLFDFDHPNWRKNWSYALRLRNYCEARMIPSYVFVSGGKGLHLSLFMDASGRQRDCDWSEIRSVVYDHLCVDAGVASDPSKIHWRDTTMGSLVRMEGALRWIRATIETWEFAREGRVPSYKFWVESPPKDRILVVKPWYVQYPPSLRLWKVPLDWLPDPNAPKPTPIASVFPRYELPDVIRRLVAYMAGGGDLSDYGRFAVGANLLRAGWDIEQIVPLYARCPDFNEKITRGKLRQFAENIDRLSIPGVKSITVRCARELGEIAR